MIYGFRYDPYIKRLPSRKDYSTGIQTFDVDNLYPQKAREIVGRSYTLKGIIDKLAGFTNGDGFVDKAFGEMVVHMNRKTARKTTANTLLNKASLDFSLADGFAIHINYNLNYKVCSANFILWDYCRDGLADEDGDIMTVRYSTNWEQDFDKGIRVIETYPKFNPDPECVKRQMKDWGGIFNYPGQILYWKPEENAYPKATFDPVFDQAQVQSEIGTFQLADIQNGYSAGHLFLYPGKFETPDEENAFKSKMREHQGPGGANSMMVIETGTADVDVSKLLVKTDLQNNDKIREFTSKDVKSALMECYGFPKPILGIFPDSGMFNQQEIRDAYDYTNTITSDRRKAMSEAFKEIFSNWWQPLSGNYDIIPQQYITNGTTVSVPGTVPAPSNTPAPTPGATPPAANPDAPAEEPTNPELDKVHEIFRKLPRKEFNNLMKYVSDFNSGRITFEQASIFLKGFKLTDEQIKLFLEETDND